MRAFIDGSGLSSTAAVQSHLAAHRELHVADLFVITTAPNYTGKYLGRTFLLTSYPSPLKWDYRGTFVPAEVQRGSVESKIGLQADSLNVTWSPKDSDVLATDGLGNTVLSAIQGFGRGIFDNGIVELWRCVMPAIGDANTLGACLMFSGRIGNIDPDRLNVNGGAIALGHPLGCTGAKLTTTLVYEMKRRRARRGIATLCLGGGNGVALAVERL